MNLRIFSVHHGSVDKVGKFHRFVHMRKIDFHISPIRKIKRSASDCDIIPVGLGPAYLDIVSDDALIRKGLYV